MRGVAILAVMIFHFGRSWVPGGWAGVDVFFTLSGYLITTILAREKEKTGRILLRRFYLRRVLRLAPALIVMVAITVAIAFVRRDDMREFGYQAIFSLLYLMNWFRAFDNFGHMPMGVTWSLAIEEQFYLLWPLFVLKIQRRWQLPWTIALLIVSIAWRAFLAMQGATEGRLYNGFDTHADSLLIGCAVGFIMLDRGRVALPAWIGYASTGALALLMLLPPRFTPQSDYWGTTVAGLLSAVILVAARSGGLIQWLLSRRPLVFTGTISYGLYLWHPLINYLGGEDYHPREWRDLVIYRGSQLSASYALAIVSFYFVERPFQMLKGRLSSTKTD